MPGIAGILSDQPEEALFRAMQKSLNHNNYVTDSYTQQGVHLACVYVKDTTASTVVSGDKRYALAFHGEVFSAGSNSMLAKPGPSVFLELIQRSGFSVLNQINGQFSACLHDHIDGSTYLITDRFGTHPLYYTVHNGRLLFASEVKALLNDTLSRKINYHSVAELFSFGHLFGYKTLFENIQQVPPATVVKYNKKGITTTEYWTYPYDEAVYKPGKIDSRKSESLQEQLGDLLSKAAREQSGSPDTLLLPLSGGLDSRYVAALLHQAGMRNLPTFTMGPEGSEDQEYASAVASALDFSHRQFAIKPERIWEDASRFSYLSDGMSLIHGALQIFEPLEQFSQSKKTVAISQMCDALFGSTLWRSRIRAIQKNEKPRAVTDEILVNLFKLYDQQEVKPLFHPEAFAKIEGLYRQEPLAYCEKQYHPLHNYYRLLFNEHGRRGTFGGNLAINLFYQIRMLSYDNDVFDFGWNLPIAYREHQYLYRKTFTRKFPALAQIKRQGYGLPIGASQMRYELKVLENKIATLAMKSPARVVMKHYRPWNRPSYVNHNQWFRKQLYSQLDAFFAQELKCGELINARHARTLLQEHVEGKRNNSSLLWQVINLEYFFRSFMV